MKNEALQQFQKIDISQIKGIIKNIVPDKLDKMIISNDEKVKRGDYVYVKLNFEKIERQVKKINFPLHESIKKSFTEFEGVDNKLGEKESINSNHIFETLRNNYQIIGQDFNHNQLNNPFDYPVDEQNGEIAPQQKKYFFPKLTFQKTCEKCNGGKYIKCTDSECDGRHNWTCTDCQGDGKNSCHDCGGDGKNTCDNCNGHGYTKCGGGAGNFLARNTIGNIAGGGCGGTGEVTESYDSNGRRETRKRTCKTCHGRGEVACEKCGTRGEIKCDTCSGRGEIKCNTCSGKGDITCSECYGDKERYGKVDCPECSTIGTVAQIVYVDSFVSQNECEKILLNGDEINVSESIINTHTNSNSKGQIVFKKVNNKIEEKYDEYSKKYAEILEKEQLVSKTIYPIVTKEEIYYQVIPCIELSYKHILTNTIHEITIVNIWDKPEIIFHSEPELLKQNLGNVSKYIIDFFAKLFKTKSYKIKKDKKIEIILMIHLAKIDGKIEDEEKISLSEAIGHLNEFTNSEKQYFFDLMNSETLPSLTKKDVEFSSNERANEAILKLEKLALADGELEDLEKSFIENVKQLIL